MKKFLLAGVMLISASTAAVAADMEAPLPTAYDWTGFYLGLNAGVAWNNSDVDFDSDIAGPFDGLASNIEGDQTVFTGGVEAGYNWQMDSIVFGVEADFNYIGFDESENFDDGAGNTANFDFEADWFGTVRGRIGFAADNLLIYGTGGLAYGHAEIDGTVTDGVNTLSGDDSSVNWGWTIGAGMQYAFNENWILGAEYLYVDLGHPDFDLDCTGACGNFDNDVDVAFSVVRAKLDFRF